MREVDLTAVGDRPEKPAPTINALLNAASTRTGGFSMFWNRRYREALAYFGLKIIPDPGFRPLPSEMCFAPCSTRYDAEAWSDGSVIVRMANSDPIDGYPFVEKTELVNNGINLATLSSIINDDIHG